MWLLLWLRRRLRSGGLRLIKSAWIVVVVVRELGVEGLAVLWITNDYFTVVVAVGQVVWIDLETDGQVDAFSLVVHIEQLSKGVGRVLQSTRLGFG